jgi:outer membrane protein
MTAVRRLLIIVCAFATIASAQTTTTVTTNPDQAATPAVTAPTDQDARDPRALRLTLDEAIKTTMERNIGLQLRRYDYQMAGESLRSQYGTFDWLGTSFLQHTSQETPTSNTLANTAFRGSTANFGIEQFIPTGGRYSVDWTNARRAVAGFGQIVNPTYESGLTLSFAQPLLRNFGVDVNTRGITIARNTLGLNREVFRATLMDTAHAVEQAYLDLVYARQFVDVVRESLFLSRDQARITQIRIDVGASAPLDILQPRVQIATSEEALIVAVAGVRNAEDNLRALMHLDLAEWDRPIIPVDPVGYSPMTVDMNAAVARALDLRPEMHELELTTDTRRIQYMYARNLTRPQVDLALEYGQSGLAGKALALNPVTNQPTNIPSTTYPTALRQSFEGTFPNWTVGFNVGVPITNIGARAEAKRAELQLAQARTDEAQTRQNITVQVRAAVRALDTTAKEIVATRTAREAAEQNLDAERKRYENGMTTNFQVLQVQQQLSDARARELQALVGYNKAVAAYHRAVGDLLEVRNIQVQDEKVEEPRFPFFSTMERQNWLRYDRSVQTEAKQ